MRLERMITFFEQPAKVACDANCEKAWGNNGRPRIDLSDNPDDYAFLSDLELGIAPIDPGTYEGGHAKPFVLRDQRTPEMINKWCVRECERMRMSMPGEWDKPLELRDFSSRLYNIAPHVRPVVASGHVDQGQPRPPASAPASAEERDPSGDGG